MSNKRIESAWTIRHELGEKIAPIILPRDVFDPPEVGIFDAPTRCLTINKEWSKFTLGMFLHLAHVKLWRGAMDDDHPAVQSILEFIAQDGLCDMPLRQSPTDNCVLQQSLDGGDTWDDVFDFSLCLSIVDGAATSSQITNLYSTGYESFKETTYQNYVDNYVNNITDLYPELGYDAGPEDFDRDAALCHSIDSLIERVCDAAIEYFNTVDTLSSDTRVKLAVGVAVLGILAIATGGVSLAAGALAVELGLWGAGIALGAAIADALVSHFTSTNIAAYQDEDAKKEAKCCLYDTLSGANVTQAVFSAATGCGGLSTEAQAIIDAIYELAQAGALYAAFASDMSVNMASSKLGLLPTCQCEEVILIPFEDQNATDQGGGWWLLEDPKDIFPNDGGNGRYYYQAYVYSDSIYTCGKLLSIDFQGITASPSGNRCHFHCGSEEQSCGGYGQNDCLWRVQIRCYGDTGIRVKMGTGC